MSWRSAYALDNPAGQIAKVIPGRALTGSVGGNGYSNIYSFTNLPVGVYQIVGSYTLNVTVGAPGVTAPAIISWYSTVSTISGTIGESSCNYLVAQFFNPNTSGTLNLGSKICPFNFTILVTEETNTYYVSNYFSNNSTGFSASIASATNCRAIKIA